MCADLLEALPAPETLLNGKQNMFFWFVGVRGVRGSGSGPPCPHLGAAAEGVDLSFLGSCCAAIEADLQVHLDPRGISW